MTDFNYPVERRGRLACDQLRFAVSSIVPHYYQERGTSVNWVNWRTGDGAQISLVWHGYTGIRVFIDVHGSEKHPGCSKITLRDQLLEEVFNRRAPLGEKPWVEHGHAWTKRRFSFRTPEFVSPSEVSDIADQMGIEHSIVYVVSCDAGRSILTAMGFSVRVGEMGREWKNGYLSSYSHPLGRNL